MCKFLDFLKLFTQGSSPYKEGELTGEIPSPHVAIKPEDIIWDAARKNLSLANVEGEIWLTTVGSTNSMEPAIDVGHIVILSNSPKYKSKETIKVGDVIVYKAKWYGGSVIHKVIEVGQDADGWFCKAQGWNVNSQDPQIIRENEITHVALGVIWCGEEAEP